MEGREGHLTSIMDARRHSTEMLAKLLVVQHHYRELLNLVIHATGEDPAVDIAREALEATAIAALKLEETIAVFRVIGRSLNQYWRSF